MLNVAVFFREFVRNFHTTGAILPSGRFLASALARHVRAAGNGRRILEVGPGTGAVTTRIINALSPDDRLDLVELNDSFVAQLRRRLETEPRFKAVADRTRVFHCPVEQLPSDEKYDLIVSGLPLNNFKAAEVEQILGVMTGVLKPGGRLSFFEYIFIRDARSMVSGAKERERLRGIGKALEQLFGGRRVERDWIWLNVPPAWVHHVRV